MSSDPILQPGQVSSDNEAVVRHGPAADPDLLPETDDEAQERGPAEAFTFWREQVRGALLHERRFRNEAKEAEELYFGPDDSDASEAVKSTTISEDVSLIHANIDVLKPLMFSETPLPVVRRRFRGDGRSDETDLMAAELGQRGAEWLLDTERFQKAIELARDDWLIAGRGIARAVYKVVYGKARPDAEAGVQSERVCPRHTEWRRFLVAPGHSWDTTPWVAFEVPMTRTQVKRRFGEEIAKEISYLRNGLAHASDIPSPEDTDAGGLTSDADTHAPTASPFDTVPVWEIWNKDEREVVWFSEHYKNDVLDRTDDPLGLEEFFPCPEPLLASTKGGMLTPRPDIVYYRSRAKEIDVATQKMKEILNTISVSGLCPGAMKDHVEKLLDGKSKIIPVAEWLALVERGGANGIVDWLPLEAMVRAIGALQVLRDQSKAAMFEASGVSDIMRAQGDPGETATAQQLKGRYAGMRLSERQRRAAFFARDLLRIMLEIAIENFDLDFWADVTALDIPKTRAERMAMQIMAEAQAKAYAEAQRVHAAVAAAIEANALPGPMPPPPEEPQIERVPETSYEEVLDRLRSDYGRKITLTIETDSTILADETEDKEARIEFLASFSTLVQQLMPLVSTGAMEMATVKELLLFGVRAFPKTRTLESMITDLPDEIQSEQAPDTQVQVAQIRAEVDRMLKEMDLEDSERDREHERQMKGVALLEDAAKTAGAAPQPSTPA